MDTIKLGGSCFDLAETEIDYKTRQVHMGNIPDESIPSRITAVIIDVSSLFIWPGMPILLVIAPIMYILRLTDYTPALITGLAILWLGGLLLCVNPIWERKVKKYCARRGYKMNNKVIVTELNSKEFVLRDISNRATQFEASGQFDEYLSKVSIKQENSHQELFQQGKIKDLILHNKDNKWSARFVFDEIPRTGELIISWD